MAKQQAAPAKAPSSTYDLIKGWRRAAFFWRLALPMVVDYVRFLRQINTLDEQLDKELAREARSEEALEAEVASLRKRMRWGFRRGPGGGGSSAAAAADRRLKKDWIRAINEVRAKASNELAERWAPHLHASFVKLGGVYIKVGQHLPAFPMTPLPYADALQPLKDGVPPRDRGVIEPLLLKNLIEASGRRATKAAVSASTPSQFGIRFVEWKACLGAASIGQVHSGTLTDGRKVAIKVQYPEVGRNFHTDVACFTRVLRLVARAQGFVIEKKWIDEATTTFTRELSFDAEAKNLRDVRDKIDAWPADAKRKGGRVLVPAPIDNLVGANVLVMELIPGRPLAHCIQEERAAIAEVVGCDVADLERRFRDAQRKIIDEIRAGGDADDDADDADDDDDAAKGAKGPPPPEPSRAKRAVEWLAYVLERWDEALPLVRAFLAMQRIRLAARWRGLLPWGRSPAVAGAATAFDARLVVDRLVYAVGRCILIDGIFSADPHPGNVIVRDGNELGFIDMGCVYRLADGERRDVALALLAIRKGDPDELGPLYEKISGLQLKTSDNRVTSAVAAFALSHFDFRPVVDGEPVIKTLQRPEFRPKRSIQCQWLPLVQRCTEILRGDAIELGLTIKLCDAWHELALECVATTKDDDAHRTWEGGREKRSELYRGDNPSIYGDLGSDEKQASASWWRRTKPKRKPAAPPSSPSRDRPKPAAGASSADSFFHGGLHHDHIEEKILF